MSAAAEALAGAGLTEWQQELVADLPALLRRLERAEKRENATFRRIMKATEKAPTNAKGQFLDPQAVHDAAEPFRPAHEAAQDARMDVQSELQGNGLEYARILAALLAALEGRS